MELQIQFIEQYLEENILTAQRLDSGLYYIIKDKENEKQANLESTGTFSSSMYMD